MNRKNSSIFILLTIPFALAWGYQEAQEAPGKKLPRVSVGIGVEEMPNVGPHGGVIIRHLAAEGPAAKAGLKKGDILVRVSTRQVDDYDELVNVLSGFRPGDKLTFTVLRDGEPKDVMVTLGEPMERTGENPEGGRTCAYLGVLTVPIPALSDDTLDRLGLGAEDGLVVVDVVPGSPAARVGLRHGDLIRSVDGEEIRNPDALRRHVHQTGVGKEVKLQVKRGEQTREMTATLAEGPCDVRLVFPRQGGDMANTIEQLRRQIEELEKRLKELEGKSKGTPEK